MNWIVKILKIELVNFYLFINEILLLFIYLCFHYNIIIIESIKIKIIGQNISKGGNEGKGGEFGSGKNKKRYKTEVSKQNYKFLLKEYKDS